jgi:hypothetical protein
VFLYPDMETAGEAFELCRDLVFGLDIDASAYRVKVHDVPHVIIVGDDELLPPVREMFERSCNRGTPTDLRDEVRTALFERRSEGKVPGGSGNAAAARPEGQKPSLPSPPLPIKKFAQLS